MTPTVTQSPAQRTAIIHVTCRREEIQQVMGPGIDELMRTLERQGVRTTGPWFTHHHRRPGEVFDFDIGVPVASPVNPEGRVRNGELRATRVAHTTHVGPYEGLGAAWGAFQQWLDQSGHRAADDFWEVYALGPDAASDPSQYRTELYRPLRD